MWREQHEDMASAVSKDDEMPELEPLSKQEEGEKEEEEPEDDPVLEVEEKAEDAYGYNEYKKRASELTPSYLASKPEEMKEVLDRLKGFRRIKDSAY